MADMDPRKLKVNELKEQLQLAGLPTTGKKEELVARLLEHQRQVETGAEDAAPVAPPTGSGDNFDWENEEVALPPSDGADSIPKTDDSAPASTATAIPAAISSAAPTTTTVTTTTAPAADTTAATATTTPSTTTTVATSGDSNKPATAQQEALLAEYEKRKNRAARFGIPLTEQDKALERAARFGIPVTSTSTKDSLAKPTSNTSLPDNKNKPAAPSGKGDPIKNIQMSQDVLNKRAERFGIQPKPAATSSSSTPSSSVASKATLYKLDDAEEEKKRKRAAKFGLPTADDASKKVKV